MPPSLCECEFETDHHIGDYFTSLWSVCGFFNVPYIQELWDEAGGLWFIVLTREHKKVQKMLLPRQHFLPSILTPWVMFWPLGRQALIPGGTPYNGQNAGGLRPKGVPFFLYRIYRPFIRKGSDIWKIFK